MNNRYVGPALMALGLVLVLVGVVRLATGEDDAGSADPVVSSSTTSTTSSSTTATSTTATSTTTSTTTSSTTTTTTTSTTSSTTTSTSTTLAPAGAETPEEFFAVLKGAFDGGDATTLFDRMNQATIDRYGAEQCEAYVASVASNGLPATFIATRELSAWDYTTDGVATTLTDVVEADLELAAGSQTVPQTTHWKRVDGRFTWFTDCGTPV